MKDFPFILSLLLVAIVQASAGAFCGRDCPSSSVRSFFPHHQEPCTTTTSSSSSSYDPTQLVMGVKRAGSLHKRNGRKCTEETCLFSSLTTALESLFDERYDAEDGYKYVDWLEPNQQDTLLIKKDAEGIRAYPLYPINAVYLPALDETYTLNNVEPRNIQMALDLWERNEYEGHFVTCLVTQDTGKIAQVGTLMRIVAADIQNDVDAKIRRIVVTCEAVDTVHVKRIQNPEAANLAYRLRNPNEYLICRASASSISRAKNTNDENLEVALKSIRDFNRIREFYLAGYANEILPHYMLESLETDIPELADDCDVWRLAVVWQSLCSTVRTGCEMHLQADRNEVMVSAAMKGGTSLKLPIHLEDLDKSDRKLVSDMELAARQNWLDLRLDPCLDFQVFLSLPSEVERWHFLSKLIGRERERIETVAMTL